MSAETVKSSTVSGGSPQSTEPVDHSIYVHEIPMSVCSVIFYFLDQNDLWEEAASKMGYSPFDIIRFRHISREKTKSPTDLLISDWGDYNHTVTELFMILYSLQQYTAMECLKKFVDRKYHRLILKDQPDIKALMGSMSIDDSKGKQNSEKILNGPVLSRESNESETDSTSDYSEASSLNGFGPGKVQDYASAIPQIPYAELLLATDNWNKETILGRGGFGIVFKGRWKYTDVAIKRIEYHAAAADSDKNAKIQMKQSLNELRYLNACRHDNILPLYGFSVDGKEPCLVYQFMAGGSLERRLRVTNDVNKPLTFEERKIIAIGTARGLQYLHTFDKLKPLIHGDIKPANILLDPCSIPKIGDFGLAREGSFESMEVSTVYGTRPYLPMEFIAHRTLSTKIDTYSYGVVLFELMTGLRAFDKSRGVDKAFLVKYIWSIYKEKDFDQINGLIDRPMEINDLVLDVYRKILSIGLSCTIEQADKRPEMVAVLNSLETFIGNKIGSNTSA